MKLKKIEWFRDFLEIILNCMLALIVEILVLAVFEKPFPGILCLCSLLLVPAGTYLCRRLINRLWLFTAGHLAILGLLYGLGNIYGSLILLTQLVIGVIYVILSFVIRLKEDHKKAGEGLISPWFLAAGALTVFLVCGKMQCLWGQELLVQLALVYIFLLIPLKYLDNFERFISVNRSSAESIPEQGIFTMGASVIAGYSIFSVIALWLLAKTDAAGKAADLMKKIGLLLLKLIRWFFDKLPRESAVEEVETVVEEVVEEAPQMMYMEATETPLWAEVFWKILEYTAFALVIAGGCFVLYRFLRLILARFYEKRGKKEEEISAIIPETREWLFKRDKKKQEKLPVFGGTPAMKIRRLFERTVNTWPFAKEGQTADPLKWEKEVSQRPDLRVKTVQEIVELACRTKEKMPGKGTGKAGFVEADRTAQMSDWQQFAHLYKKARYSEETITREDLQLAKQLAGRIKGNL